MGQLFEVIIGVKNNGSANSDGFKCSLLVSVSPDAYPLTNGVPVYNYQAGNLGSIAQNQSKTLSLKQNIYDNLGGLDLQLGGTYYMY